MLWGLCAAHKMEGESAGQEGEGEVVSLEWLTGPAPPCATRPLTDVLELGMGTLFSSTCRG